MLKILEMCQVLSEEFLKNKRYLMILFIIIVWEPFDKNAGRYIILKILCNPDRKYLEMGI